MPWSHFAHGADIGIRGSGASRAEAFAEAARALTAVVTEPERVAANVPITVSCDAPDDDLLFLDWLNAIIFQMSSRRMLFSRFDLTLEGRRLSATIWGESIDRPHHRPAVEVKGATFTGLRVWQRNGVWTAECVVDV